MEYIEQLEADLMQLDHLEVILQENRVALESFTERYNTDSDYDKLHADIKEYLENVILKYESVETNMYNAIIQAIHSKFYDDLDRMHTIMKDIDASLTRRDIRLLLCQLFGLASIVIVGVMAHMYM